MTEKKYHSLMLLEIDTEQKAIRAWDCISEILVREENHARNKSEKKGEKISQYKAFLEIEGGLLQVCNHWGRSSWKGRAETERGDSWWVLSLGSRRGNFHQR